MPATEYFGYTISNLGPLTTTFTAPSSCSTGNEFHVIAPADGWSSAQYGRPECGYPTMGECFASGDALDEINKSLSKSLDQGIIPYFSPGLHCPSGWTTAGTLAQADSTESASLDSEGFLTGDLNPFDEGTQTRAAFLPVATILVEALQPLETLVWCCPSGHTANLFGGCMSSVGPRASFSYTEACGLVIPEDAVATVTSFDGSAWDPPLLTVEADATTVETFSADLSEDTYSDAVVVNNVPAVVLVHQPTDTSDGEDEDEDGGSGDGEGEGEDGNNAGNAGDDGDAASSLRAMTVAPMAAVMVGLLAGVGALGLW